MYLLYSLLLGALLMLTLPYWLVRMMQAGKYRAGLSARLGELPTSLRASGAAEDCIWVHAVSVGEVLAVSGLVKALRLKFPQWRIAISTTTQTGFALAR